MDEGQLNRGVKLRHSGQPLSEVQYILLKFRSAQGMVGALTIRSVSLGSSGRKASSGESSGQLSAADVTQLGGGR
jgi:hypothetical protein